MSAFRESVRAMLQDGLICPGCTAMNRPGATVIEVSQDCESAYCIVCSVSRPIARFQLPEKKA